MLGHNHKGYLVVLGQLWAVLVGTSRYLVSKGRCSSVFGGTVATSTTVAEVVRALVPGTGSALGGTCWYLVVLGQYKLVLFGTRC